jgi:hypothetical protein
MLGKEIEACSIIISPPSGVQNFSPLAVPATVTQYHFIDSLVFQVGDWS